MPPASAFLCLFIVYGPIVLIAGLTVWYRLKLRRARREERRRGFEVVRSE